MDTLTGDAEGLASTEPSETLFAGDEYGYEIEPFRGQVQVIVRGVEVASTHRALLLTETRLAPVFYFPRDDVRTDLLSPSDTKTHCPFRGNASYWSIDVDGEVIEDGAWSYEAPYHDARRLRGYVAFYADAVSAINVDSAVALAPDHEAHYPNPLIDWALRTGPAANSAAELVEHFTEAALAASIPIWRVWVAVQTLHPLLFSTSYTWQQPDEGGGGGIVERTVHHGSVNDSQIADSPLRPILDGAGGVRCRLEGDNPDLDYPVVRDHWKAGATDYVAVPLTFSDGQINVLSLTTKEPGGFTTRDLGFIYEVLPAFARLLEVHAASRKSVSLLRTYLGRQTGERVLNGSIKRGDRDRIRAVVWFCDLRDSSQLAEELSSDDYIDTLNQFYDCLAQPVLDNEGEVLRFIGDAALAIFPIDVDGDPRRAAGMACTMALTAVNGARSRLEHVNRIRARDGHSMPIRFGLGLHLGELTYGNIGTADRLEFTVIGHAANVAARLQDLCKTLGRSVLLSETFVQTCRDNHVPGAFERQGHSHSLRGIREPLTVYALR